MSEILYSINPDRNLPWNDLPLLPVREELYRLTEIYEKLGEATASLARLQGRSVVIPDQGLLINTISLQEAKASSAIENIFTTDDELYKAFTSTGLTVPADLLNAPRTIFSDPAKPDLNHFYDQIAWFTQKKDIPEITLKYVTGGTFDFVPYALASLKLPKSQLSYRISDHYPLWAEFDVRQ